MTQLAREGGGWWWGGGDEAMNKELSAGRGWRLRAPHRCGAVGLVVGRLGVGGGAGMLPRVREESAAKSAVKMASRPVSGRGCQGEGQFC